MRIKHAHLYGMRWIKEFFRIIQYHCKESIHAR